MRDERMLFEDLSFRLDRGQMLLVEGRNGSGKTSLLRILCGIRQQESGEVLWNGDSIHALGAEYHQHMAYVGHHDGIKGDLTVQENLRLARALGNPSTMQDPEILEKIRLSGYEDILSRALSAGQRRKLALSRLLATDSTLWILDEPFTALDTAGISLFEALMSRHTVNGGIVVMTSHHQVRIEHSEPERLQL